MPSLFLFDRTPSLGKDEPFDTFSEGICFVVFYIYHKIFQIPANTQFLTSKTANIYARKSFRSTKNVLSNK